MGSFSDRLCAAVQRTGTPAVVGLDPRMELLPPFILEAARHDAEPARVAIRSFHEAILDEAASCVPAVKLQIAFYEQYGLSGLAAFADTISMAKERDLIVIVDAKRNDIDSTATAYAQAFLGVSRDAVGFPVSGFDVDCITVSPYLGRDSLAPFVDACSEHSKGIFILVKTSNPGSTDVQNLPLVGGQNVSQVVARLIAELGEPLIGSSGYSPIGAVVGATFPAEARHLREIMPRAIFLVPGYGAQGADASSAVTPIDAHGLGAIINASRTITYPGGRPPAHRDQLREGIRLRIAHMVADVAHALGNR